jgi:hypothetical protein
MLKEFGSAKQRGQNPEKLPVPGTLFRLEIPQQRHVDLVSGEFLLFSLVIGALFLSVSIFLYRKNLQWVATQEPEKALVPDQQAVGEVADEDFQDLEAEIAEAVERPTTADLLQQEQAPPPPVEPDPEPEPEQEPEE